MSTRWHELTLMYLATAITLVCVSVIPPPARWTPAAGGAIILAVWFLGSLLYWLGKQTGKEDR